MDNKKLILVTNDDGYQAEGIGHLAELLRPMGEVIVCAPDGPRSGEACGLTPRESVRVRLVSEEEGLRVYACSGTPVDCVKIALEKLCPRKPDLVASGINEGDNMSISVHYSGTMGAALEACMKGVPGVGFSLVSNGQAWTFSQCDSAVVTVCEDVLRNGLPQGVCLNVNVPNGRDVLGLRLTRQAKGRWCTEWEADADDPMAFHLTGYFETLEPEAEDTDCHAVAHGYASVTPTTIDMTAYIPSCEILPDCRRG